MNRLRSCLSRLLRLAPLLALSLALAACKNRNEGGDIDLELPSYAELAAVHNQRVALLETMYAFGAIEIRWSDDDGKHFQQGDLDVWLRMPDRIAMQVGKAGERFFWLGGNNEASWFFDLRTKGEKFAEIYGSAATLRGDGDVPIALSMTALLELMGLAQIPEEKPPAAPDVAFDRERSAWMLSTECSAGPMRLFLDVKRNLPVRVELLSSLPPPSEGRGQWVGGTQGPTEVAHTNEQSDPAIILYSVLALQRYEYIFMKGRANDQFPRVPTLIDVYSGDDTGSLKISVSRPVAEDESFQDNYFDLDWLMQVLQPDEVRDYRRGGGGDQGNQGSRDREADGNDA